GFHPTTGYSCPIALRIAEFVALADHPDAAALWGELGAQHRDQVAFALRLNRMLFDWFAPAQRHHVLARFYRLPADTIARFYALTTTHLDRARVVLGRPPRGLSWRALLTGRKAWALA
ncbi:MAG: lycopene cyclase family protein, partial [Proteobacteria bacterium]|nr:lycopene cyclase family protein [Pseudomonadota bacterium]